MSKDLKPYVGVSGPAIYKCDTADNDDAGTGFKAYIKTRSIIPAADIGSLFTIGESIIIARATAGVVLQHQISTDFDKRTQDSEVDISPELAEARVIRKFSSSASSDIGVAQIQVGDPISASVDQWSIDSIRVPITKEGDI